MQGADGVANFLSTAWCSPHLFGDRLADSSRSCARDYEHFKELNPDATPADDHHMQQQMDDFDAWGLP